MKAKIQFPMYGGTLDTIVPRGTRGTSLSRGAITLAHALEEFIAENSTVRAAQTSKVAADALGTSTVKALYRYLDDLDFDVEILVGKRYLKQLVLPSPRIALMIEELGPRTAAAHLTHGVVRVNDLILDLLFQKLGSTYKRYNNFPLMEFEKYWMYVLDVNSLVEITPEHVKRLVADAAKNNAHQLTRSRVPGQGSGTD